MPLYVAALPSICTNTQSGINEKMKAAEQFTSGIFSFCRVFFAVAVAVTDYAAAATAAFRPIRIYSRLVATSKIPHFFCLAANALTRTHTHTAEGVSLRICDTAPCLDGLTRTHSATVTCWFARIRLLLGVFLAHSLSNPVLFLRGVDAAGGCPYANPLPRAYTTELCRSHHSRSV